MSVTHKEDMIIPEVVAEMVEQSFGGKVTLLPVATQDNTLQGKPGDTLKFPAFRFIGKAARVDENGQVQPGLLSADTVSATVHKYAKAVVITDEARLSGFGDPVGEAARQLAQAIDHAVDDELFQALEGAGLARKVVIEKLTSDAVADALTLFGEEQDGPKLLITDAQGVAALRKDPGYLRCGDMAQELICSGVVGEIWGCQILISQKIAAKADTGELQYFIVKPGALRLVSKTGTQVEVQREPEYMRDTIYASKHCTAYLYDAGKVISLTRFTGLQSLTNSGIAALPGGAPGTMRIAIPDSMLPPAGYAWVYKLDDSAQDAGTFGTAFTGTAWPGSGQDIAVGASLYVHVLLVATKDQKPVKTLTLPTVTA